MENTEVPLPIDKKEIGGLPRLQPDVIGAEARLRALQRQEATPISPPLREQPETSWKNSIDSIYGRSHGMISECYQAEGVNYLKVWETVITKASENTKQLNVLEIGSGNAVLGLELASVDQGQIPIRPQITKFDETGQKSVILPQPDVVAQQIVDLAKAKGVTINYFGITEADDGGNRTLLEEKSDHVSVANYGLTLEYDQPGHTLPDAIQQNKGLKPDLVIANYVLTDLDEKTLPGVLSDVANTMAPEAIFIAFPFPMTEGTETKKAFNQAFSNHEFSPVDTPSDAVIAVQIKPPVTNSLP